MAVVARSPVKRGKTREVKYCGSLATRKKSLLDRHPLAALPNQIQEHYYNTHKDYKGFNLSVIAILQVTNILKMRSCITSVLRFRSWRGSRSIPGYGKRSHLVWRSFTSESDEKKHTKQPELWKEMRDTSLKGVGQVIFLNSQQSGAILLGSLALGDPYLAALAATGALTSTTVAKGLKLDKSALDNGLLGYNGTLMGCVSAVFIAPQNTLLGLASTVPGAAAATVITSVLPKAMAKDVPQWTFAFNIAALTQLLRVQPLIQKSSEDAPAAVEAATVTFSSVLATPFVGLSQIFVVESGLSGLGVVTAISSYSPLLAAHALAGSTVGALTGLCLGAPAVEITAGLWGFNSALTSMGVAVFFKNNNSSIALSLGGAAATAALFGGLKTLFGVAGSPCLTLPFCITMTGCYMMAGTIPSLSLASSPHSPEKNTT